MTVQDSQEVERVRKHLSLITEHPDEEKVGNVEASERQKDRVTKNSEGVVDYRNVKTGKAWEEMHVGLGYHDFESEQEYNDNERFVEVVSEKLAQIDDEHLEKAGLNPEDWK